MKTNTLSFVKIAIMAVFTLIPITVWFMVKEGFTPLIGDHAWIPAAGSAVVEWAILMSIHHRMDNLNTMARRKAVIMASVLMIPLFVVDVASQIIFINGSRATDLQSKEFFRKAEEVVNNAVRQQAWTESLGILLTQEAKNTAENRKLADKGSFTNGAAGFGSVTASFDVLGNSLNSLAAVVNDHDKRQKEALHKVKDSYAKARESAREAAKTGNYDSVMTAWSDFRNALAEVNAASPKSLIEGRIRDGALSKGMITVTNYSSNENVQTAQKRAAEQIEASIKAMEGTIISYTGKAPPALNADEFDQGDILMRSIEYGGVYLYLAIAIALMMVYGLVGLLFLEMWMQEQTNQ